MIFLKKVLLPFFISSSLVLSFSALAAYPKKKEVKYRTSFGKCPSRTAGSLTLQLIKSFEKQGSLRDVKLKMVNEKLAAKHFISTYKISYDPLKNFLQFNFDCPEALMKVQIYKDNGIDSYEAILVDNGELYDPTYEVLLRSEKKLDHELPFLAIPVGEMEEEVQQNITKLVGEMLPSFRKKISEVILSKEGTLTIILSVKGRPSSAFLGADEWEDKVVKLTKFIKFAEQGKKIPAIINLTNSKKVVVKFNDKI